MTNLTNKDYNRSADIGSGGSNYKKKQNKSKTLFIAYVIANSRMTTDLTS